MSFQVEDVSGDQSLVCRLFKRREVYFLAILLKEEGIYPDAASTPRFEWEAIRNAKGRING
jgi:hypothetical protein